MAQRIFSFPPVVSETSKILILGSVPGVKSLEKQQYYAHPQNKFWKIIFELFNEDLPKDYEAKLGILSKNNIALSIPAKGRAAWILKSGMRKPIKFPNF